MTDLAQEALPWISVVTAALLVLAVAFAAATIVLRLRSARAAARWARLEAAWTPVVVEILAGDRPPAALNEGLAKRDRLLLVDFLLLFARRLRGREREVVCSLARPYLGLVARRLAARNPERRARAAQELSVLGGGAYAAHLVRSLDDPSPLVAMVSARALAAGGSEAHIRPILGHLRRFEAWNRRYLAAMLANLGSGAAAPLRALLSDGAQPERLRAVATDALRTLRDLTAADVAAEALAAGAERELAAACLRLLAALGRPEHLPRVQALLGDGDPVVRAAAVRALAALGGADALDALRRAVDDRSPWVAMEGARGMLAAGGAEALADLAASHHPRAVTAQQVLRERAA